jgi:peptidoglycan/LPS O-acetylase OafA/YrhL
VTERVHPLDWLRVLALLGVFVYHTLRPFDTNDWHVKNAEQSEVITILLTSMAWGLALFFLLAGAGSGLALRWRTPVKYARERLLRLGVPLVSAYLLLSPVQAYLQDTSRGEYDGSFPAYVPHFFDAEWANLHDGPDFPLVVPWAGHLWFLVFLLWFSLLGLPVLLLLRRPHGQQLVDWLGRHAHWRGAVLLWAVPLALVNVTLPAPAVEHGWAEFVVYFGTFLAGALLLADQRLVAAVRRDLRPAVYVAVAGTGLLVTARATGAFERWSDGPAYSWSSALLYIVITVWAWGCISVALALGLRATRFQHPLPQPVGAAAMPFFLVHQPVILVVALVVVDWHTGIVFKLPVLFGVSLVVSVAIAVGLSRLPYVSTLVGVKRRSDPVTAGLSTGHDG